MENNTGNTRYQVMNRLGKGGYGEVYRVFDTFFRCESALKCLSVSTLTPDFIRWFTQYYGPRFNLLSQLQSPNIIRLSDYTMINNVPSWTMELETGASLLQYSGRALAFNQAAALLIPVADALAYAHQCGIVHGNLKPANILFGNGQVPILTDFSLAEYLSENGHGYGSFEAAAGVGNPDYLAPEQARGQAVDARTDVYSLGMVFYELITGRKPYSSVSPMETMKKQVNEPLPSPRYFTQNITPAVEQVLYQATAKQPQSRFSSMGEFAYALRSLASDITYGTAAYQPGAVYAVGEENDEEEDGPGFIDQVKGFFAADPKRKYIGAAVAAVILIAIIIGIVSSNNKKAAAVQATATQEAEETSVALTETMEAEALMTAEAQSAAEETQSAMLQMTSDALSTAQAQPTVTATVMIPTIDQNATLAPTAHAVAEARFQSQNISDGASLTPGSTYTISWTIENTGGSNWTEDFTFVFASGTNMTTSGITAINFPETVWPGGATTFSLDCTTPYTEGSYSMSWNLCDASGSSFYSVDLTITSGGATPTPTATATETSEPSITPTFDLDE